MQQLSYDIKILFAMKYTENLYETKANNHKILFINKYGKLTLIESFMTSHITSSEFDKFQFSRWILQTSNWQRLLNFIINLIRRH